MKTGGTQTRFLALAALWLGLATAAAGEPYRHAPSGFVCADEIAGFQRVSVHDYESKQPGLGVACKYFLAGVTSTT